MDTFSTETASDGLVTEHNEAGVLYKYNNKTLELQGEQDCGDVFVDDALAGSYERDDNDVTVITLDDGREWRVDTEEDYAAFARAVLA